MATDAVSQARNTTERVSELSKAATRIGDVVELINTIAGQTNLLALNATIERLSEISSAIAAAVEEQGAATQEIARNVQQAAQGTQQVSSNITDVQRGATETGTASSQVLSAAQMLSNDSTRLKTEVSKFLTNVRAV